MMPVNGPPAVSAPVKELKKVPVGEYRLTRRLPASPTIRVWLEGSTASGEANDPMSPGPEPEAGVANVGSTVYVGVGAPSEMYRTILLDPASLTYTAPLLSSMA